MIPTLRLLVLLLALTSVSAQAAFSDLFSSSKTNGPSNQFLPVDEAFQVKGSFHDSQALIHFSVTEEHYLYKDSFKFVRVDSNTRLFADKLPPGKPKFDQFQQKELEVYTQDIDAPLTITDSDNFLEVDVTFQGCADAGLCYPPHTVRVALLNQPEAPASAITDNLLPDENITLQIDSASEDRQFTHLLTNSSWIAVIGIFLVAGIGLTFTPCVLPMVPILSSLIVGNRKQPPSRAHTLSYSSAYVFGMAVTFALAGTLMGYFGAGLNLQAKLQSPWVLIPFALLFVVLALSMFGFYELQMPSAIRNRVQSLNERSQDSSLKGAMLMGVLSSLVVSPCVTAPLAGALVYIGTTGDALLGGLALFALGLGMGIPLLLLAFGGGSLLPKAGAWMESVKAVFGVMLIGVAIWMLERLLPGPVTLLLWAMLLIISSIYMGAFQFKRQQGWQALWQGLGLAMLIYGGTLIIGATQGGSDPFRPLQAINSSAQPTSNTLEFTTITNLAELERAIDTAKQQGLPVFVDFYADWCISCKVTERELFPQPEIHKQLQRFALIRADVTDNNAAQQQLLQKFQLFGPPAFLFYSPTGEEITNLRAQGEPTATSLINLLDSALGIST